MTTSALTRTLYTTPLSITSQFPFCGLPLRLDTYRGCGFRCAYCFARNRGGNAPQQTIRRADPVRVVRQIDRALTGERNGLLAQCLRHRMPLHLGGMSDPLQPIERTARVTEDVLRGLLPHRYPVVLSTRSDLVADSPYFELLRDLGAVVQFSFCSLVESIARRFEPLSDPPDSLLRAMETLASAGVPVTCRWQPFIPTMSEQPAEFVPRIAATGCRHIALEHLKLPLERNWHAERLLAGQLDFESFYRQAGARRDGRELVLPASYKLPTLLEVRALAHQHGMSFGAADNELQFLSDTACCCSGVDQFPGFENYFRHQIGFAVHESRGADLHYGAVALEWVPDGSIDRYLNSKSRSSTESAVGSIRDHVRARWNDLSAPANPTTYYGVVPTENLDPQGNRIYRWAPDARRLFLSGLQVRCTVDGVSAHTPDSRTPA